jgi:hypothetical protein
MCCFMCIHMCKYRLFRGKIAITCVKSVLSCKCSQNYKVIKKSRIQIINCLLHSHYSLHILFHTHIYMPNSAGLYKCEMFYNIIVFNFICRRRSKESTEIDPNCHCNISNHNICILLWDVNCTHNDVALL